MKRIFSLFILLLMLLSQVYSDSVPIAKAHKIARNFFELCFSKNKTFERELSSAIASDGYFVFNLKNNDGFIIVSGDDDLPPVPGYSFSGSFDNDNNNEAFRLWMKGFSASRANGKSLSEIKSEWNKLLKGDSGKSVTGVGPLLTIAWGQACYYNAKCPVDSNGNCYHARTGCGATAMAMIMKYWEFPAHGYGGNSYQSPLYGNISADFENTWYDWQNMPPKLYSTSDTVQVNAVAQLMFHCGVAVNMVYGPAASSSDEWNIRNAFTNYFKYSSQSQYLDKADFADTVWRDIMKNEIDNGRPVFYEISSGSGGHFVVMDGYQDDDYFHFNWGYGNLNGYYKTFDELPVIQQAIVNIKPNSDTVSGTATFYSYNGIFNDGSNEENYLPGKTFSWLIEPEDATSLALMFTRFSTEYKADFVNIYDGDNITAPLLGSFSGHKLPPVIQTSGNKALVRFVTNDSVTDAGWELRFTTLRNGYSCSGVSLLTDSTGTFDDGSGSSNYIDNADCFWLIKPDTASSITLHFDNFNTEKDWDFLYVYKGENPAPENLLATLTGNISPADITSTEGAMLLHFHSDWNTNRPGWQVSYTTGYEKIYLDLKVFLEGAFTGTSMDTNLRQFIPLSQPFDNNPSANYYYEGTESVNEMPLGVVDWLLIELRNAASASLATGETIVARQAALLTDNGRIVNTDGSSVLSFNHFVNQSLFVVIYHRNHLPVMTANPLTESGGIYTYDFTTPAGQAYGTDAQKNLGSVYGMYAGDANCDNSINISDLADFWLDETGLQGYLNSDLNLDGQSNNIDKNDVWLPNEGKECQVPE